MRHPMRADVFCDRWAEMKHESSPPKELAPALPGVYVGNAIGGLKAEGAADMKRYEILRRT
jgi:hypothetical protein